MENPNTWNDFIILVNNELDYGNDPFLTMNDIMVVLVENNLITEDNNIVRNIIDQLLINFKIDNDNQTPSNTLGNQIYFKLKSINFIK